MLAAGMMQKPPNTLLMIIGAMSLFQGMQSSQAAQEAATAGAAASALPVMIPVAATQTAAPVVAGPGIPAQVALAANNGMKTLATQGYKITSEGVQTPEGNVLPSSTFNSTEAMKQAGFSGQSISDAQSAMSYVKDHINLPEGPAAEAPGRSIASVDKKLEVGKVAIEGGAGSHSESASQKSSGDKSPWDALGYTQKTVQLTASFCAVSGRAQCPTCQQASGQVISTVQIEKAKASCPMDPMFMNPANASRKPASDVAGSLSPSVFNIASDTLNLLCQKARLNCGTH